MANFTFFEQDTGTFTFAEAGVLPLDTFPPREDLTDKDWLPDSNLPDVLRRFDEGTIITDPSEWTAQRRQEVKDVLRHYGYGFQPELPDIDSTETVVNKRVFGDTATLIVERLTIGLPGSPTVDVLICIPDTQTRNMIVQHNSWYGIHATIDDTDVPLHTNWTTPDGGAQESDRGAHPNRFDVEQIVGEGYVASCINHAEIAEDRSDNVDDLYNAAAGHDLNGRGQHEWGWLMAQGWGHALLAQYVKNRSDTPDRITVSGISRRGKGALIAAAFYDFIDAVVPMRTGMGGTTPKRQLPQGCHDHESYSDTLSWFPHWYAPYTDYFANRTEELPYDTHFLVALCEPRNLFAIVGDDDPTEKPECTHAVLTAANDAFDLVGEEGYTATEVPGLDDVITSQVGLGVREGTHDPHPNDWIYTLQYLDSTVAPADHGPVTRTGTVTRDGNAVQGADVVFITRADLLANATAQTTTDASGEYSAEIPTGEEMVGIALEGDDGDSTPFTEEA